MRLRLRSARPYDALYTRAESALNELCAREDNEETRAPAESVYRETLGVLRRMRAVLEGVGEGVFVTEDKGEIR